MKTLFQNFELWIELLEGHPRYTERFWNGLTPRFLDYQRKVNRQFAHTEDYGAIPAWYYIHSFDGQSWNPVNDEPF
jgi:hypothetical protein